MSSVATARYEEAATAPGALSVMTYSDDIAGLGHMRRNSLIASRLARSRPGVSVLMMTGLPSGCPFEVPAEVDFMKLPSIGKVDTGNYRPRMANAPLETTRGIRSSAIECTAELFQPDLFLVDHMPAGIWGELIPTLERLKARPRPPKIVLGLRDILDAPAVTRRLWNEDGIYDVIARFYDAILIYGAEEMVDTRCLYGLGSRLAPQVEYCGYLCEDRAVAGTFGPAQDFARRLAEENRKLVVVTVGGGHDGFFLLSAALQALGRLNPATRPGMFCVTGPFMGSEERKRLGRMAEGLPVEIHRLAEDGTGHLEAADVVISMGGYNTVLEALQLGKRMILVPRSGPSAEQRIRAGILASRGLVTSIDPENLSPALMAEKIMDTLRAPALPQHGLRMDGLDNTVRLLNRLLDECGAEADGYRDSRYERIHGVA